MNVMELLTTAVEKNTVDIFLILDMPSPYKMGGRIIYQGSDRIMPDEMNEMIKWIYGLTKDRNMEKVQSHGDDDSPSAIPGVSRFRASVFGQGDSSAGIIRVIRFELSDAGQLHLPKNIIDVIKLTKGVTPVTNPTGNGRNTTLACIIDEISRIRNTHAITLENPIEYLHRHRLSIMTQREIVIDVDGYVTGLGVSPRQAPSVTLLGEMRNYEAISIAMAAVEAGHLILSILHTVKATSITDRVIDAFPPNQQQQTRAQLTVALDRVTSQQLISTVDGDAQLTLEIMFLDSAIHNVVRESRIHQVDGVIVIPREEGMVLMDSSLIRLYREGRISCEDTIAYSNNSELMEKKSARWKDMGRITMNLSWYVILMPGGSQCPGEGRLNEGG